MGVIFQYTYPYRKWHNCRILKESQSKIYDDEHIHQRLHEPVIVQQVQPVEYFTDFIIHNLVIVKVI